MPRRVLFLPGFACTSAIWKQVIERMPSGMLAAAVDWPREQLNGFPAIQDFSAWLADAHAPGAGDALVGHSLGGLVALRLALNLAPEQRPRVILVESFITPPRHFFQNLVAPGDPAHVEESIKAMLAAERGYYSAALAADLRQVDFRGAADVAQVDLRAVYGDRGSGDPSQVRAALGWPADWLAAVPVAAVANAAHFPMLENPVQTAQYLQAWL